MVSNPVLRPDLRILKVGKDQQELDVVLFDGAHKAVIGEHKSHLKSKKPVDKLVETAEELRKRAEEGFGACKAFRNRKIALAFMAESIAPGAEQSVLNACTRRGFALFRRSGSAVLIAKSGLPLGRGFVRFT